MRMTDVNSTDLKGAIELGCRTMGQVFNADDGDVAFMSSRVWPEARFGYSSWHAEAHIPGRHLNALFSAQSLVGIPADPEVVRRHADAAYFSFSGPVPLPLNRLEKDGEPCGRPVHFIDHNIREGFFAMYNLAHFCGDSRADDVMRRGIECIETYYMPDMNWNEQFTARLALEKGAECFRSKLIAGVARCIGPLVRYYRYSGYEPALRLAEKLTEEAIKHYPEDGSFDQERMGTNHCHSVTCVLSSMAMLADLKGDTALMERIRKFYDNGLRTLGNELGWFAELTDIQAAPARGEINISGDVVETALILGKYYGVKYYDDAERIIRAHILPSQLRDIRFIRNPENPENRDALRNVAERHYGAFGFPAPYGHQPKGEFNCISFNMDIVGGGVSSLCEAYAACSTAEDGAVRVNLLFDREDDAAQVTSPYSADGLTVTLKHDADLYVRIPSWADPAQITVIGAAEWRMKDGYAFLPDAEAGQTIKIVFPIPDRDVVLKHRTHTLRARLRGDIVTGMDNEGTDFTFFPEYGEAE